MTDFEILGRVASGSSGVVWQSRDRTLDRLVALKEVDAGAAAAEATALAALDSEHVVTVHGVVTDAGRTYLVEEWVNGATLAAVVRSSGRLSTGQALGIARGMLLGLAAVHAAGLVHGDLAPSNVLVTADGAATLVDFGSVVRAGTPARASTVAYAAPEVAAGGPATPAGDVYAAAAVLALLLHGRTERRPSTAGVDPALRRVLDRALTTDPGGRHPDAAAFLTALEDAARHRYGDTWWTQAGLGAAATSAGAGLVAVLTGAPFAATTAGTAAATGGGVGGAMNGVGAATGVSRKVLYLGGGVGGAVVAGAVVAFTALGGEDPRPGREVLAGRYAATFVITSSTFPGNPVGSRQSGTVVIRSRCDGGTCELTVTGFVRKPVAVTGTGRRVIVRETTPNECNTNAEQRAVAVTERYVLDLAASGSGRPRELRGTLTNTIERTTGCRGARSVSTVVFTRK